MTPAILAATLGRVSVAEDDLRFVLTAWFEPEYPTEEETEQARKRADEVLENIATVAKMSLLLR